MKTLSLSLIPLLAALASPMALAQDGTSATNSAQADGSASAAAQEATPTPQTTGGHDHATGTHGQSGTTGATGAQSSQLTWADVDTDGSGAISKAESSGMAGLSEVFDRADADGDGQLTPDEYRAFAASSAGAGEEADATGTD